MVPTSAEEVLGPPDHGGMVRIDENYRVITLILKKYSNLPLCLENYALFLLPLIFTTILYTYPLRYIIYLWEPSGNIILGGELIKPEIKKAYFLFFDGTIWCSLHLNIVLLLFIYFPTWSAPILASKLRFLWFLLYLVVFTSKTGNW